MYETYDQRRLTAVLGPTNTGKTYLAIDRMLGHASGMIGFPLRLLARENYDRVRQLCGASAVALITGEERIVPPDPRYFFCTVEAMPMDRTVDFLAIDEVQLCGDPERGHIFTDRLLHARGAEETMFLGAETIARLIRRLVPGVTFESRPRFSKLSYAGHKKVTRLPPRSAVIAFSTTNVYRLAEHIRQQRGGAAVVLGALSPRTRNAQVALYEAGEVDYIVATDAIGMGLNMAVNHVAFSATRKFDGRSPRSLNASEIGQIAGRAGRHTQDGTFGTTADEPAFGPEMVEALETHSFEPLPRLYWRNRELDFNSLKKLKQSLDAAPPRRDLTRVRIADDYAALAGLMDDPDIAAIASSPDAVRLLWTVCQIPNFRNELTDGHQRLAGRIFRFLMNGTGVIPTDWIARAVDRLDRTDGDIDTLITRISHVRTWTYISHRANWLDDAEHWQNRARVLEDALSDALHDRLTQRFVDTRATTLLRRLDNGGDLLAAVTKSNDVVVEGVVIGRIEGFRFIDTEDGVNANIRASDGADGQIMAAAKRALRPEIASRIAALLTCEDMEFSLTSEGLATWRDAPIARLVKGQDRFHPQVDFLPSDLVSTRLGGPVTRHLTGWLRRHLDRRMKALSRLESADLTGPARGLAYQLVQGLGSVQVRHAKDQLLALNPADRAQLTSLGVQFGTLTVFLGALMSAPSLRLRALLCRVYAGLDEPPPVNLPTLSPIPGLKQDDYSAFGYVLAGIMVVRADRLERLVSALKRTVKQKPALLTPENETLLPGDRPALAAAIKACGFGARIGKDGITISRRAVKANGKANGKENGKTKKSTPQKRKSARRPKLDPDAPFAKLSQLQAAK